MKIVKYQKKDFADMARCMDELQSYLASIDPLKLLHHPKDYGKKYVKNLLKEKGIMIYLATEFGNDSVSPSWQCQNLQHQDSLQTKKDKVLGCIAGKVEITSKADLLEWKIKKSGYILDLFVFKEYRWLGVAKQLMKKMEDYFKAKGCRYVRTAVFVPNTGARKFYKKLNYQDRLIKVIKRL